MEDIILKDKMPSIGFGTFRFKNDLETSKIVCKAIKNGYKMIDTACSYLNEEAVGKGIKDSKIKREELFISGKLWNDAREFDKIIAACKKTIANLGCSYLDLYLVHWPASKALYDNWIDINNEVWKAMEYLYEQGLVKAIGVSNFKKVHLEELLKTCKIKPMVNQIEFHIGFMQDETYKFCLENDILIQAWSPNGGGKLLKKEPIINMANKYNVSPARLCLRWCLQNKTIPLARSSSLENMLDNLNIFNFKISDDDMEILNNMPYLGGFGYDSETMTLFG